MTLMDCKVRIERIMFQKSNGDGRPSFCILIARCLEPRELGDICIKGSWDVLEGQTFQVSLNETVDPKYGKQYLLKSSSSIGGGAFSDLAGVEAFLTIIKGVGEKTAKKITKAFGYNTMQILDSDNAKAELKRGGITPSVIGKVLSGWEEHRALFAPMSFLLANGITPKRARGLIDKYGDDTERKIKGNPYSLADEIAGIGFKTADRIAIAIGMDKNSPVRAKAGICYLIKEGAEKNGHLFLKRSELAVALKDELSVECTTPLEQLLKSLESDGKVVLEDEAVYSVRTFDKEVESAAYVHAMLGVKKLKGAKIDLSIYSAEQKEALEGAMLHKLYIITGLPGTGKTTCLKTLVKLFESEHLDVTLCAPTGKASKRLSEVTERPASTIHRALKASRMGFEYNKYNPIPTDVVIVDEASMVDSYLFHCLITALPPGCRLVLVGDTAQLPPVGAGRPLLDLIDSGKVGVTRLVKIFRQAEQSNIIKNAHTVNDGVGHLKEGDDFIFIDTEDNAEIRRTVQELFNGKPSHFDMACLSPMHKGDIGVGAMNELIQKVVNPYSPTKSEFKYAGAVFREGDRVMQMKNNYDKGVFNGEQGIIKRIKVEDQYILVDFGDFLCEYMDEEIYELKHCFASSIHKVQGSEYDNVVIIMSTSHFVMLQRNLLYTGITRAAKRCIIIGSRKAVHMAASKLVIEHRNTRLAARIKDFKGNVQINRAVSTFKQGVLF